MEFSRTCPGIVPGEEECNIYWRTIELDSFTMGRRVTPDGDLAGEDGPGLFWNLIVFGYSFKRVLLDELLLAPIGEHKRKRIEHLVPSAAGIW